MLTRWVALFLVLVGLGYLYLGFVTHDPARWHVDPTTAARPEKENFVFVLPEGGDIAAPVYSLPAADLARAFDETVRTQPRVRRIAGAPARLHLTYVQTSARLRLPDYISVKVIPVDETHATLAIYSRARFGYGDRGVNRARVEAWLQNFESFALTE